MAGSLNRYRVRVAHRDTGKETTLQLEAESPHAAVAKAGAEGWLVSELQDDHGRTIPPSEYGHTPARPGADNAVAVLERIDERLGRIERRLDRPTYTIAWGIVRGSIFVAGVAIVIAIIAGVVLAAIGATFSDYFSS